MTAGSRFATLATAPCAFVLSEQGKVRYASRSTALREAKAWVALRMPLPQASVAARLRAGGVLDGPAEIDADVWFSDWDRGGLLEDARHLKQWDQTVALLWFEDEEVPPQRQDRQKQEEEEFGLAELDGVRPWPGKKRRK